MSTLAIVQARFGGTRLPGKVLADIGGRSMLDRVCERLAGFDVHVAYPPDDLHEDDVLSRYVRVVEGRPNVDTIIRVTADCPLLDPGIVAFVHNMFQEGTHDFVGTAPEMDGLDVECFTRRALLSADVGCRGASREHVTTWMRRHLSARVVNLAPQPLRWSVDDAEGLEFVRAVYRACVLCARGVPHHTNSATGIGGMDRKLIVDLHQLDIRSGVADWHKAATKPWENMGGLAECQAADLKAARMGERWRYVSARNER